VSSHRSIYPEPSGINPPGPHKLQPHPSGIFQRNKDMVSVFMQKDITASALAKDALDAVKATIEDSETVSSTDGAEIDPDDSEEFRLDVGGFVRSNKTRTTVVEIEDNGSTESPDSFVHNEDCKSSENGARKVRFSTLTILEFEYDIGDNPTPRSGPSVTIQWKPHSEVVLPVDTYERAVAQIRKGRSLLIPAGVRLEMLLQAGCSRGQIIRETRPVNIARTQRRRTIATLGLSEFHEMSEMVSRKTKNILTFGMLKRKEKEYLTQSGAV
jgi:hypothetical protein